MLRTSGWLERLGSMTRRSNALTRSLDQRGKTNSVLYLVCWYCGTKGVNPERLPAAEVVAAVCARYGETVLMLTLLPHIEYELSRKFAIRGQGTHR